MKKYKLLKDWWRVKAGEILQESNTSGALVYHSEIKITEADIPTAIEIGLIKELDVMDEFISLLDDLIERNASFYVAFKGLELMCFLTDNSFAIEINKQVKEWYKLKENPFYSKEQQITVDVADSPQFYSIRIEDRIFLRGDYKHNNNKLIHYSSDREGAAKKLLKRILIALKECESELTNKKEQD